MLGSGSLGAIVLGLGLLLLGASGAGLAHRRAGGRPTPPSVLALVPFGILIGAGAALIRGWDLTVAVVAGGVIVPIVGFLSDVLVARRRARS
jgi:hypothetical protein